MFKKLPAERERYLGARRDRVADEEGPQIERINRWERPARGVDLPACCCFFFVFEKRERERERERERGRWLAGKSWALTKKELKRV